MRFFPPSFPAILPAALVGVAVLFYTTGFAAERWGFEPDEAALQQVGGVTFGDGPDSSVSANLPSENRAALFDGDGDYFRVPDSPSLRFDQGDEITVEGWIRVDGGATNAYIIGKGRLSTSLENQNWALRLMKVGGSYRVSFLFRSRAGDGADEDFHRWNSKAGISTGKLWHHVAVSYRFGEPGSVKAFVDGVKTAGDWDLGGATKRAPVVDDAEVWIGSSRGGAAGNCWHGAIDSLAVHREILADEVLAGRVDFGPGIPAVDWASVAGDAVTVDVFSGLTAHAWPQRIAATKENFSVPAMALLDLPARYAKGGSRERRRATLVRMAARVEMGDGPQDILLRAPSLARLWIDGQQVAELGEFQISSDGHQLMRPAAEPTPYPRARLGTRDQIIQFTSDKPVHELRLEAVVGRDSNRFTLGELLVATRPVGEGTTEWRLLGSSREFSPTGMEIFRQGQAAQFIDLADARRVAARAEVKAEWEIRHAAAREYVAALPALTVPDLPEGFGAHNAIDQFLAAKIHAAQVADAQENPHASMARKSLAILEEQCFRCHGKKDKGDLRLDSRESALAAGESGETAIVPGKPEQSEVLRRITNKDEDERMPPKGDGLKAEEIAQLKKWIAAGAPWASGGAAVTIPPVLDDAAFLRRLYLDTVGIFPTPDEIRAFVADRSEDKIGRKVDALLKDTRHADHWTGYWQDVLAENPRLVKGKLNNTGPFRWWINEALRDKLPFDQFVRELIGFGGSQFEGGAAGFKVATENDSPAAAKAHVLATAFLGTEMKCARCHDAPYHESKQKDLFSLAAMLEGKPLSVPQSSTVPATFFTRLGGRESLVKVTLNPGVPVQPAWPFGEATATEGSPRERLASELTGPHNQRFAQVIVNRVWKRYFGQGFVEPAHDWEGNAPSHPRLLDFLARDFVAHGYDLDRLSTLILTSDAYRREPRLHPVLTEADRMFEAPLKRRLTSEQLVDSLFAASGVPIYSEELTFDVPGSNNAEVFQNMGRPSRAWQFVSLASDRDRPSLTLPYADSIVALMKAFGWRSDRSEPITDREAEPTVLQPGMLANGVFGTWITRLSPYSDLTGIAVEAVSPQQLVDELYLRFLGREPLDGEKKTMTALLADGFDGRLLKSVGEYQKGTYVPPVREVTWSNHLSPEANVYAAEIEKQVELGPPVSDFLEAGWRGRMEDVVWAIVNSPEMQFLP